MRVFFDTSVLIGGLIDFGPASAAPRRLMSAVAEGGLARPATAWHCCLEFFAVTTRLPGEYRLTPEQALTLLESCVLGAFDVECLAPRDRRAFLAALVRTGAAGGRVYDAHIAEIAERARADVIVTENTRHFGGVAREVRVARAAELAEELGLGSA